MKRILQLAIVLALWCIPAHAAITVVQHKHAAWASGSTIAVTITANSASNMLVVCAANRTTLTVSTVADNATGGSNTYTQFGAGSAHGVNGTRESDCFKTLSAAHAGATTVTVTFSGTVTNSAHAEVWEVSGFVTAAEDGGNHNGTTGANPAGASVTTTSTTGFCVGALETNGSLTANPAAGNEFTSGGDSASGADNYGFVSLISSTAAAHNPAWTATSAAWVESTACFKETPVSAFEEDTPPARPAQQQVDYMVTVFGFILGLFLAVIRRTNVPIIVSPVLDVDYVDRPGRLAHEPADRRESLVPARR